MDQFQSTQPIYLQIMALIKRQIATAQLRPGGQLGSVRELAMNYQVNPNTVQRALSELEREGLLKSDRTVGRYVTDDLSMIEALHRSLFLEATSRYVDEINELNVSADEAIRAVRTQLKGENT